MLKRNDQLYGLLDPGMNVIDWTDVGKCGCSGPIAMCSGNFTLAAPRCRWLKQVGAGAIAGWSGVI